MSDKTVKTADMISDKRSCAVNDLLVPAMSRAPTYLAVITENPAVQPNANCKNINVSGNVSFTPATCFAESTCPQIMASVKT